MALRGTLKKAIYACSFMAVMLAGVCNPVSAQQSCQSSLKELDEVLDRKEEYEQNKLQRIELLKSRLEGKTGAELYGIYHKIYLEYDLYNFDSAYMYMGKMRDIAIAAGDRGRELDCDINLAYCCVSAGLFFEANEILDDAERASLDEPSWVKIYSVYAKLYFDMARSIMTEPHFSEYNQRSIAYSEEIIRLCGGAENPDMLPHLANIYRCRQDYRAAADAITRYMESRQLNERSLTLCAGGLGEFSLMLGDTTNAIGYLCFTSIADTKAVTKETPGLSLLAGVVYKQGDVERAFKYAKIALDDANSYNARHRKMEVGNILPIIDASRYDLIERQKNIFLMNTILLSVLLLVAGVSGAVIIRQVRQLKKARRKIEAQNDELQQINTRLETANQVKEEYIGYLFKLNSAYMSEFEGLHKFVKRKLVAKQHEDLLRIMSRTDPKQERKTKLTAFDDIVLKLFPSFVRQFNSLFDEQNRFILEGNRMLTPEMRIFALIKLGVSDSEEIARILNYSVHTINTYKTKAKNRSLVANEEFEEALKSAISHQN